jgi:BirA family biotin operon repressor/biotin-[acetyl-CoA-carboxylase] ligase
MSTQQKLFGLLADGELHSGTELAAALDISRTAVWKQIRQLAELDVTVEAQAGQGYRLPLPVEPLDQDAILAAVQPEARSSLQQLDVLWATGSTSDFLLQNAATGAGRANVCVAEYQSGGRGRRGRKWFAPAGAGICLSVAWHFSSSPASLSCLGLAAGVGVLRALRVGGINDAQLKWPNDIILDHGKLAGILVDVKGEAGGPLQAVIGVGLNFSVDPETRDAIGRAGGVPPAGLTMAGERSPLGRNRMAGSLISEIVQVLQQFEREGFAALAGEWRAADYLCDRSVEVQTDNSSVMGVARGISVDGQLQVEVDGKLHTLVSGDVSVRTSP